MLPSMPVEVRAAAPKVEWTKWKKETIKIKFDEDVQSKEGGSEGTQTCRAFFDVEILSLLGKYTRLEQ